MPFEVDLDALQPWEAALRPPSPSFAAASSAAFAEATAAEFGFSPPESPLVLAFEDAIPLSSRFAIMKVQMEGSAPGSSGPLDHIADSVRWLIAMRMIVEKVVENGFTSMDAQGTSAMLHAHARGFGVMMNVDPTNMSDDTKVVWIRRMLPPRAAPAQLCGVLSGHGELADGKTHVRYTSTPLVPLEYRVGTYGESIFRRGDISLMCPTPSILQYAIAQLGQNALHVKNRTTEDGWVKSYFCPPAEVEEASANWKPVHACAGCGRKEVAGEKFKKCSKCHSPVYCGKECQVSHWRSTHKRECRSPEEEAGGGGASSGDGGNSVLVSLVPPAHMRGLATSLISVQGSGISTKPKTKDHAPKDVHGGSKFIVKLQLPTVPGNTKALIYDEKRSFQCADVAVPDSVVNVIRRQTRWFGMKAFINARREGENLRLYLDQVSEQPW